MNWKSIIASFVLAAAASAAPQGAQASAAPSVTVSQGVIIGTTTQQPLATKTSTTVTVTEYLGVPFAQNPPPRFAAASPVQPWSSPIIATSQPSACIQQMANSSLAPGANQSESCLYLNVYVPPGATTSSKLPVMFWIYGGDLFGGYEGIPQYNGASFAANQNVILVTINYRLNIFGFSMSPQIPLNQRNAGFHDQRLALDWVNANIASFGGDPNAVTVFGESAGGFSVQQLLAYPPSPSRYRAAIVESRGYFGNTFGSGPWDEAVALLNCTLTTDQLACMRSKSVADIQNVISSNNILFGPVNDNASFASDIRPRLALGQVSSVPVLIGTNGNEGSVLANSTGLPPDVITNYEFLCLTSLLSKGLVAAGNPVYRYLYNASFPNTTPFPGAGAYHSAEIPEVFGTYPQAGATAAESGLSIYMQTAWANFAKNPSANPQSNWPQLGTAGNVQLLGGAAVPAGGQTVSAASVDSPCPPYYLLLSVTGY